MDWLEVTNRYHERALACGGSLSALSEPWQRELAALWRLESEVNNGGYLQFVTNWDRDTYACALQGLQAIGAHRMAKLIAECQAIVDEHFDWDAGTAEQRHCLMPNKIIDTQGRVVKEAGSVLPENVLSRIYDLSYQFMDYPEDLATLGLRHYRSNIERDGRTTPCA